MNSTALNAIVREMNKTYRAPVTDLTDRELAAAERKLSGDLDDLPAAFSFDSRLHRLAAITGEQHRRQHRA